MSQPEIIPAFSCLEYKWHVQREVHEETKELTPEQELRYFREAAENGPLGAWWKALQQRRPPAGTADALLEHGHERGQGHG
jgi:hypothetical protein